MKKSKYCKKGVLSCKNMWKMVSLKNWNMFWNVPKNCCSLISREACVVETTHSQVCSFLPQNTLNSNHGLNYLDNLYLFSISHSFRIQGIGTGITPFTLTTFPELDSHLIWYVSIETLLRKNSLRILWKYLQ